MNSPNKHQELKRGPEKRKHARRPCSAPIEYDIQDQTYRNLSRDISAKGIYIETWDPFSVGEELTLNIPLSDDQEYVKVEGKVVRTDNQGIGIEFI